MKEYFELGRFLKPQGIRGELKAEAYTDDLSRFSDLGHIYLREGEEMRRLDVQKTRVDANFAYLTIQGICDRNDAESMRGRIFYIDRAHAAKLPDGHQYIADLIGLAICDRQGNRIGVLKDIYQYGAADIYAVQSKPDFLFPAVPHVVLQKDIAGGVITVDEERLAEVRIDDL